MVINFVIRGLGDLVSRPTWLAIAAATAVAVAFAVRRAPDAARVLAPRQGLGWRLLAWGFFLLGAAAFPYITVGQGLASEGWLTRNCILCPLPVAMLVTGSFLLVNDRWHRAPRWAWLPGVAAVAALGVGGCVHNYLVYQAFGVKQLAIRARLADAVREARPSVVQLRDYIPVPGTIPYYPPVIWTYLATGSTGEPTAFVIETTAMASDVIQPGPDGAPRRMIPQLPLQPRIVDEAITATTMPYALENISRSGPQVLAAFYPAEESSRPAEIGRRYLLNAWLAPARAADMVRDFTKAEILPLPPIQ
jgi:hypothetical protein